jgi:hypothetical protein
MATIFFFAEHTDTGKTRRIRVGVLSVVARSRQFTEKYDGVAVDAVEGECSLEVFR